MSYTVFDFLGNIGVFFIITTYLALQTGRTTSTSMTYSVLNALGAVLILVSLYHDFNLSAFVIESFWLLISLYGMHRCWSTRGAPTPEAGGT